MINFCKPVHIKSFVLYEKFMIVFVFFRTYDANEHYEAMVKAGVLPDPPTFE